MKNRPLLGDLTLLITAFVWGMGFVAQRSSIDHVGAFTYNGVRFLLGALAVLPLYLFQKKSGRIKFSLPENIRHGTIAGLFLWAGASMQQYALFFTTAGKAGFITGLYVVIVPFAGIVLGHRLGLGAVAAAFLSVTGLFFLSVTESFSIHGGDLVLLISTVFWTLHILYIGSLSHRYDASALSIIQFVVCSVLSIIASCVFEAPAVHNIVDAAIPILYGGIGSVGMGFTLQVVGQRYAPPSHSAVLLSMESVFAAVGAFFLLGEIMGTRSVIGCVLMFAGMIIAQLFGYKKEKPESIISPVTEYEDP